jgi:hypothetical protein
MYTFLFNFVCAPLLLLMAKFYTIFFICTLPMDNQIATSFFVSIPHRFTNFLFQYGLLNYCSILYMHSSIDVQISVHFFICLFHFSFIPTMTNFVFHLCLYKPPIDDQSDTTYLYAPLLPHSRMYKFPLKPLFIFYSKLDSRVLIGF